MIIVLVAPGGGDLGLFMAEKSLLVLIFQGAQLLTGGAGDRAQSFELSWRHLAFAPSCFQIRQTQAFFSQACLQFGSIVGHLRRITGEQRPSQNQHQQSPQQP